MDKFDHIVQCYKNGFHSIGNCKTSKYTTDSLLYDAIYLYGESDLTTKTKIEKLFTEQSFDHLVISTGVLQRIAFGTKLHQEVANKIASLAVTKKMWKMIAHHELPNPAYSDQLTQRGLLKDIALQKILDCQGAPTIEEALYVLQNSVEGTMTYNNALHYLNSHQ